MKALRRPSTSACLEAVDIADQVLVKCHQLLPVGHAIRLALDREEEVPAFATGQVNRHERARASLNAKHHRQLCERKVKQVRSKARTALQPDPSVPANEVLGCTQESVYRQVRSAHASFEDDVEVSRCESNRCAEPLSRGVSARRFGAVPDGVEKERRSP